MFGKRLKKLLSFILSVCMAAGITAGALPAGALPAGALQSAVFADAPADHLIINQAYGNGKNADGAISHSFIEIYNPTASAVDLSDWSLQYATTGKDGEVDGSKWTALNLGGAIPPNHSYLVRANGGRTAYTRYEIHHYDMDWPLIISNDSFKFALVRNQDELKIFNPGPAQGVVDLIGAYNTGNTAPVDYGEGGNPLRDISKQKTARRVDFADTDDNAADFISIDYRTAGISDARLREVRPASLADGPWTVNPPWPPPPPPITGEISFDKPAGLYESEINLSLGFTLSEGADGAGYTIRYTLDGEDPTADSDAYAAPLRIYDRTATDPATMMRYLNTTSALAMHPEYIRPPDADVFKATVVKARLFGPDGKAASGVYVKSYFVNRNIYSKYGNLPIVSIATPHSYFFDNDIGIYVRGTTSNDPGYIYPDMRPGGNGHPDSTAVKYNWDQSWERPVHVEMFDSAASYSLVVSQGMGVRMHGSVSRNSAQKSLRLYARNGIVDGYPLHNGKPAIDYDLFLGAAKDNYGKPITGGFKRILLRAHGNDIGSALMRDPLASRISAEFENETAAYRPVVAFLNGEFWGEYEMMERFDDEYMAQHYGGSNNNYAILENPSSIGMTEHNGTQAERDNYLDVVSRIDGYLASTDINTPAAYAEILKYVDEDSLIDYTIAKTFVGDNDWVNRTNYDKWRFGNNNEIWRWTGKPNANPGQDGKYRFILKDSDMAFLGGLGANGGGEGAGAQGMAHESIATAMTGAALKNHYFFGKLMGNDAFKAKFVNRYMDVLNTYYSLNALHGTADAMAAQIRPILPEQKARWNYTPSQSAWQSEINNIKSQMTARVSANPSVSGIASDLNRIAATIPGAGGSANRAPLRLKTAGGKGFIRLNGIEIKPGTPGVASQADWTGNYYVGFAQRLEAVAPSGYKFVKWTISRNDNGAATEKTTPEINVEMIAGGYTVTAEFTEAGIAGKVLINQVYGLGDNASAISHSFVELYNTSTEPIDISEWSVQFGTSGANWQKLDLIGDENGELPGRSSYLVRANGSITGSTAPTSPRYRIGDDGYDQQWNGVEFSNRAMKIALVGHQSILAAANPTASQGVLDLVGAINDPKADSIDGYETRPFEGMSKQKSVRRDKFKDTDNNFNDFIGHDYRTTGMNDEKLAEAKPRSLRDGPWGQDISPPDEPDETGTITFGKPAGLYESAFYLTLASDNPNLTVRYTLDGEDPNPSSPAYAMPLYMRDRTADPAPMMMKLYTTGPRNEIRNSSGGTSFERPPEDTVFKGTVVKARLFDGDGRPASDVYVNSYFVNGEIFAKYGDLPVFSVSTPSDYFFSGELGIYVRYNYNLGEEADKPPYNFDQRGAEWERPVYLEMFDPVAGYERKISQGMGVRIHGGATRHFPQKSLRFYARTGAAGGLPILNGGASSVDYDLFDGEAKDISGKAIKSGFKRFLLRSCGNDSKYSYMRDALSTVLSADLGTMETQGYRPAIMFLNGEFWGFYQLLERFDDEYVAQHAADGKAGDYGVLENPTPRAMNIDDNGDQVDIDHYHSMVALVNGLDMRTGAAYDTVRTIIDEDSLIDYTIIETFGGNSDWVSFAYTNENFHYDGNNQRVWRYRLAPTGKPGQDGRYRWMLYDTDKSWGYTESNQNYSNFNTLVHTINNSDGRLFFFTKLMQNQAFRAKFANRYMDMLNTRLKPSSSTKTAGSIADSIEKAIIEHKTRYPYTMDNAAWRAEIAGIKTWLEDRAARTPGFIADAMRIYDPAATSQTAALNLFNQDGRGYIRLNGMDLRAGYPGVADQSSWSGLYFVGADQTIEAVATGSHPFTKFIVIENIGGRTTEATTQRITLRMIPGGYNVIAVYGEETGGDEILDIVDKTDIYKAAYIDDANALPDKVLALHTGGAVRLVDFVWDYAALSGAKAFDLVEVNGHVSGRSDLTLKANLEIIPRDLMYFIDCGTAGLPGMHYAINGNQGHNAPSPASSAAYDAIGGRLAADGGKTLRNDASDRLYDGAWGLVEDAYQFPVAYLAAADRKLATGYVGWDIRPEYEGRYKYIEYRMYLPKGEYKITTGHFCWWDPFVAEDGVTVVGGFPRTMEILYNGVAPAGSEPFTFRAFGESDVFAYDYTHPASGELAIRINSTAGDGAVLSFIGIAGVPDEGGDDGPIVAITENAVRYVAAYNGEEPALPATVGVRHASGKNASAAVTWNKTALYEADDYETVKLTGDIAGSDLKMTAYVEMIPKNLVYYIDCGTAAPAGYLANKPNGDGRGGIMIVEGNPMESGGIKGNNTEGLYSLLYPAVKTRLAGDGKTLSNEVSDKVVNAANLSSEKWGLLDDTFNYPISNIRRDYAEIKYATGYLGFDDWEWKGDNQYAGLKKYLEYSVYLPKGTYGITTGHYSWWPFDRYMTLSLNDMQQGGTFGFAAHELGKCITLYNEYTQDADGYLSIKVHGVQDGDGAALSFLGIHKIETDCAHGYVGVRTEPTCLDDGYTTYTCSKCGDSYVTTDSGSKLGHSFTVPLSRTEPTCTTAGSDVTKCARCDETRTTTLPALGHSFTVPLSHTEPTCTTAGSDVTKCARCDETRTTTLPALDHAWSVNVVPATCTAGGYTEHICGNDASHNYIDSIVAALGHSYTSKSVIPATCERDGSETFRCIRCGDEYTVTIPKNDGHVSVVNMATSNTTPVYTGSGSNRVGSTTVKLTFTMSDGSILEKFEIFTGINATTKRTVTYDDIGCYSVTVDITVATNGETNNKMEIAGATAIKTSEVLNGDKHTKYTVTYNLNGGAGTVPVESDKIAGEKFAAAASGGLSGPEGFAFKEWNTAQDGAGTAYAPGAQVTMTAGNLTLYAVWIDSSCAIHTPVEDILAATCTDAGYKRVTCTTCGALLEDITYEALGHDWVAGSVLAPTCTTGGYTPYTCSRCDATKNDDFITALGHDWIAGTVVEPTCLEHGYSPYTCSRCDATKDEDYVTALGHDWVAGTVVAPTCLEQGYTPYTCSRCEATKNENYTDALNHDYSELIESIPPSCAPGSNTYKCVRCDETWTETIAATGLHTWVAGTVVAPTCTTGGYAPYTCSECGTTKNDDIVAALGHDWVAGATVAPTCLEHGYTPYACSRCDATKSDDYVTALGHDWVTGTVVAPTCLEHGYTPYTCSRCDATKNEDYVAALGHDWVAGAVVAPTYLAQGYTPYTCSRCGATKNDDFTDRLVGCEHDFVETVVNATCTEDGSIIKTCTRCGIVETTVIPAPGHVWVAGRIVAPTASARGYTIFTCSVCGLEKQDNFVAATGDRSPGGNSPGGSPGGPTGPVAPVDSTQPPADKKAGEAKVDVIEIIDDEKTPSSPAVIIDNPFTDIYENDWYYGDVLYVFKNGIMKGTGTEPMAFSPNVDTTRGMIVTLLYRMAGSPNFDDIANPFEDVDEAEYYYLPILWAATKGIVLGYGEGLFGPDDTITREQLAAIVYRYQNDSGLIPGAIREELIFIDWDAVEDYAKGPVNALTTQGLINGKPNGLFDPKGLATRAETAAVFRRFIEAILPLGYVLR